MKDAQLVVRLTSDEYTLLKSASKADRRVLSDWVRLSLIERAKLVLNQYRGQKA